MARPASTADLAGYSADADGIVFRVLQPVLSGDIIRIDQSGLENLGQGQGASWSWTADRNIAAGSKVTLKSLLASVDEDLSGAAAALLQTSFYLADIGIEAAVGRRSSPLGEIVGASVTGANLRSGAASESFGPAPQDNGSSAVTPIDTGTPGDNGGQTPPTPGGAVYGDGNDTLINDGLILETVEMKGGDDTLVNSGTIIGTNGVAIDMGEGDDSVTLLPGSKTYGEIRLGAGDDRLVATGVEGDLNIDAGDGDDEVIGGDGDDLIRGGAGDDLLDGGDGDDVLDGGEGNDLLIGGEGDDFLFGRAGDDTLIGGEGNDLLDGGEGIDTADYSADSDGVTVDLGLGRASGIGNGRDTLSGIENVIGGSGDDVLIGNDAANILYGGAGNDRIVIGAGDMADGGAGDDRIEAIAGGTAGIVVSGGTGEDALHLRGTGAGKISTVAGVETLTVEAGQWSVAASSDFEQISVQDGAAITSGILIDNDDIVDVAAGGRITTDKNTLTWAGGGDASLTNAGLIAAADGERLLQVTAGATGTLVLNNLAGGTLQGAVKPGKAGAADAAITINNAGLITADGRVIDFRDFDANGASATINNLAGGVIRQYGENTDIIRPGQNGTVNNWGLIAAEAGAVAGGDAIDFQEDHGGTVNNHAGAAIDGAKHAVTGKQGLTLLNEGIMIGRNGSAVNIDSDGTEASRTFITNSGVMEGRAAAGNPEGAGDGDAIDIDGLLTLINSGTIAGLGAHGSKDGEANVSEAIAIGGGSIVNQQTGVIYGYGRAIQVDNSGNAGAPGATQITNHGTIKGEGHGPEGVTPAEAAGFDLRGNAAINLIGDHADMLVNGATGRIIGGIAMGGGNDTLENAGAIFATDGSAIDMGEGDDRVTLLAGAMVQGLIRLGAGNDTLIAATAAGIEVDGGAGDDLIEGGAGNDTLLGGEGNDVLRGGAGDDLIFGGAGDDLIHAGPGKDTIDGGEGYDTLDLSAASGPLFIDMASGRVSGTGIGLTSFTSIENIAFGAGDNDVTGGNGDDVFDGGAGNDTLSGGAGDDKLSGGEGNDLLRGGSGDDLLEGGVGDDVLQGGSGDDILRGGEGNDQLSGGSGDDILEGGAGDDLLSGGSGDDTFVFAANFGHDRITDFGGWDADVIEFTAGLFADFDAVLAAAAQIGTDVVITVDGQNTLTLAEMQLETLRADDFRFV